MRRDQWTSFTVLAEGKEELGLTQVEEARLRAYTQGIINTWEELQRTVVERRTGAMQCGQGLRSRTELSYFTVVDIILFSGHGRFDCSQI